MNRGTVIVFYSFKGGVGRTMALANIAALLARARRRVLSIDWDLEAAGLHHYFRSGLLPDWRAERGLLDLVESTTDDWRSFLVPVTVGAATLDLLPSGRDAADYVVRLGAMDWAEAYRSRRLGERVERWKAEWTSEYDFVLIDSRTGLSDIGGICTIQLPDILVMLFTANHQSVEGTLEVAASIRDARENYALPLPRVPMVPVLARFEGRTEVDIARRWMDQLKEQLTPLYAGWLDASVTPAEVLRYTRIPNVPRWSFDESLPVLVEDVEDPETISHAYASLAGLLMRRLEGTGEVVGERGGEGGNSALAGAAQPAPFVVVVSADSLSGSSLAAALRAFGVSSAFLRDAIGADGRRSIQIGPVDAVVWLHDGEVPITWGASGAELPGQPDVPPGTFRVSVSNGVVGGPTMTVVSAAGALISLPQGADFLGRAAAAVARVVLEHASRQVAAPPG